MFGNRTIASLLVPSLLWCSLAIAQNPRQKASGPALVSFSSLKKFQGKGMVRLIAGNGTWYEGVLRGVDDASLQIDVKKTSKKLLFFKQPGSPVKGLQTVPCRDVSVIQWREQQGPMRRVLGLSGLAVGTGLPIYAAIKVDSNWAKAGIAFGALFTGVIVAYGGVALGEKLDRRTLHMRLDTQRCGQ
jgi:hypothetical protein